MNYERKWETDLDAIIVFILMLNVYFLNFLGEGQLVIEWLVRVVILGRFIQRYILKKDVRVPVIFITAALAYLMIITIINGTSLHLYYNALMIGSSILVYLYLGCITCYRQDIVNKYVNKSLTFFHVYYWINTAFIIIQTNQGVFYDNRTGFLGAYGTHRLMCFVCFLVLADIRKAKVCPQKKMKHITNAILIAASSLIISSFNDNTAMYVVLPIVIVFYIVVNSEIDIKILFKVAGIGILAYISLILLMKNQSIAEFLNKRLFDKLLGFTSFFQTGEIGEERYIYIQYALENLNGFGTGVGLGKVRFLSDANITRLGINYRNWGMTNMASFIAVGGLAFTIVFIIINERMLLIGKYTPKCRFCMSVFLIIMCYYTQPFIGILMPVCIWHMLLPILCVDREKIEREEFDENWNTDISIRY